MKKNLHEINLVKTEGKKIIKKTIVLGGADKENFINSILTMTKKGFSVKEVKLKIYSSAKDLKLVTDLAKNKISFGKLCIGLNIVKGFFWVRMFAGYEGLIIKEDMVQNNQWLDKTFSLVETAENKVVSFFNGNRSPSQQKVPSSSPGEQKPEHQEF